MYVRKKCNNDNETKTGFWLFRNKVGNNVFFLNDIFKNLTAHEHDAPRKS